MATAGRLKRLAILWCCTALSAVLPGCTRCTGKTLPTVPSEVPPMRIHNTFTSTGDFGGQGSLTGQYILTVPKHLHRGEKPGLLLHFHADGRAEHGWDDPGALNRLAKTGEKFKLITIAMQEPHKGNWWQGHVADDVHYVDDFIQNYLLKRLTIDQHHIFFTGVSGGADFAGSIFPVQTKFKYHGAALVTCGGDLPARMLAPPAGQVAQAAVRGFRFFFANVEDDPDFPPDLVGQTASYFSNLGFRVARVTASHQSFDGQRDFGTGHCSFDTPGWRDRFLEIYYADEQTSTREAGSGR